MRYVLRGGIAWRLFPHEFPPWQTVYNYFRVWRIDGARERITNALRELVRVKHGKGGPRGYDGGPPPPMLSPVPRIVNGGILDELTNGHGNATIARHLSISSKTVANHLSTIFAKLHVPARGAAIVRARDAGFGAGPPNGA